MEIDTGATSNLCDPTLIHSLSPIFGLNPSGPDWFTQQRRVTAGRNPTDCNILKHNGVTLPRDSTVFHDIMPQSTGRAILLFREQGFTPTKPLGLSHFTDHPKPA